MPASFAGSVDAVIHNKGMVSAAASMRLDFNMADPLLLGRIYTTEIVCEFDKQELKEGKNSLSPIRRGRLRCLYLNSVNPAQCTILSLETDNIFAFHLERQKYPHNPV
jgi:hypothetical protein